MPYLLILFIVFPVLEMAVLIKVGTYLGAFRTIAILLITGALGSFLARVQGVEILKKIDARLKSGVMPSEEMLDGGLVLAAGILLLIPGFLSDIAGLFLLFAPTRAVIKMFLKNHYLKTLSQGRIVDVSPRPTRQNDDVEDAEFHS